MYSQRNVIDVIENISPSREAWAGKAAEELPRNVTLHFRTGQTGLLDMKDPRAVHWAGVIDELARDNRPVYVEIDRESNVITTVLIPEVMTVEKLDPDEHGDLMVRLRPSSAIHLLLRSRPDFEAMRADLQAALDDGSKRLITETRDEHEIIDVRRPVAGPGGPSDPAPPAPEDPPVSEARAGEVFGGMKGRSCVPCNPSSDCVAFLFPDDGCWIRAHIMCHLMRAGGPDTATNPPEDPEKVWINAATRLVAPTVNHPDCRVEWGWHVAPTLTVSLAGGDEKRVIDPSLSPAPESEAAWKNRQGDPGATLTDTAWTDYNWIGDTQAVDLATANQRMQLYRNRLRDRCLDIGPPPYSCTKSCFFIVDRDTFSNYEIEAMLHVAAPALIEAAFYIVVDGFSPYELGFTSPTMQMTPALNVLPNVPGMTITAARLEFEYPAHLNRRQRLTWVYNVGFADTSGFTAESVTVTLQASVSTVASTGYLHLIRQPNPYETDGDVSWLSTDLRVFQIREGESKFNVAMGTNPSLFITQVLAGLNAGNTGGQTFENNISVDQQTSRLELSQTVNGTPVFNFAVAKVRYRALSVSAADVRVFFRLFPVATTSLAYDLTTAYRRSESGGAVIPLLGIANSEVTAIPCFASPRIDSAAVSLTAQTDAANVQTLPPNPSGAEVVRYFGCWLDINQTAPQFPLQPSPLDGPYSSGRISIQDHIRNEHQCLVSEIAFAPAPAQNGSTPSVSDKLAQRNLAIVQSANPGLVFSRRIPQTFEIRPSSSKTEHDELMIDWGNVPAGSVATLYIPGIDANETMLLSARNYRSHRLVRIDEHTLRMDTGGITYLPLPLVDGSIPGMLTVDLPEGVKKGQVFRIVVRQVTGSREPGDAAARMKAPRGEGRHIVGAFQITIPVSVKADMLTGQQRLLSNLRWIERAIPGNNRWSSVFGKYVTQIAARVDALGGDAKKVAASPSGQWQEAYRRCRALSLAAVLLIATLVVFIGALTGVAVPMAGLAVLALLAGTVRAWNCTCRPKLCQRLRVLFAGSGLGAVILALLAAFGISTPHFVATLIASASAAAAAAIACRMKGCFKGRQGA